MIVNELRKKILFLHSKAVNKLRQEGLKSTAGDLLERLGDNLVENFKKSEYRVWIEKFEPTEEELERQKVKGRNFKFRPLISVLVPTYETDKKMLLEMLDSVVNQTYANWELCIADGASKQEHVREVLEAYQEKDIRIKVKFLKENQGIIGNSQEAFKLCEGEFVGLLDHDDLLAPFALYEIVKAINEENPDFIYSDEDIINAKGTKRYHPHFKPEWSPDTLKSYNYITHFLTLKRELFEEVGGFREGFEGSQDHDLCIRAANRAKKITHIPKVLYHWRAHQLSMAGNLDSKTYVFDSAKKSIGEHCLGSGLDCKVTDGFFLGSYRVRYEIKGNPKVSIFILRSQDNLQTLKKCIDSIVKNTSYPNYEILIVENLNEQKETIDYTGLQIGSNKLKILTLDKKADPKALNLFLDQGGVTGYLLLLESELEIVNHDWLESMLEHAQRQDVGVVGAKILNHNKTLRHAGIVLGMAGSYGYVCENLTERDIAKKYYCRYLVNTIRNVSAVSGAMMIEKEKFLKAGGLQQGFGDQSAIELCLKTRDIGLVNIYTPYATLIHSGAQKAEQIKTHSFPKTDPYYSTNLDYQRTTPSVLAQEVIK